jgi:hypothetical protein
MCTTTFTEGFATADLTEAKSLLLLSKVNWANAQNPQTTPLLADVIGQNSRPDDVGATSESVLPLSARKPRLPPCSSQLLPSGSLKEAYMKEKAVGSRNKTPPLPWNTSLTLTQRLMMSSRRVDEPDGRLCDSWVNDDNRPGI